MKPKKAKLPGADLENSLPSPQEKEEPDDIMDDHQAASHLDTIVKAHGIQQDPAKMAKVHALAGRHMDAMRGISMPKAAITSTDDLRKLNQKKFGKPGGMPSDGE